MRINVAQLLKERIGSTRTYKISEIADSDDDGVVSGCVRLTRTNRSIIAKVTICKDIEVICSRCLSSFVYPAALDFEEEYFPTIDIVSGAPLSSPDEPGSFAIDEHHTLDLAEAIRQYALLAVPMKPLCRDDCAGLCPGCGHDLNEGPCDCPPTGKDPRWAKLRELLPAHKATGREAKGA